jgi:polysaccharide pyruvyl transferase WcaK-like protein
VAAINPFYWPVRPSLTRLAGAALKRDWSHHYEKWYFFASSPERTESYRRYIAGLAEAINRFRKTHPVGVALIGMEALDLGPCQDLQKALDGPSGIFSSRFYDGYQMTAVLHSLSMLVTSRYHAKVLSMTGGVPAAAVSMDERLYNIFQECGQLNDYYLSTDEAALGEKLHRVMEKLWERRAAVRQDNLRALPRYLKIMAEMGQFFRGFVERSFPGITLAPAPKDWQGYLPALRPELRELLKQSGT